MAQTKRLWWQDGVIYQVYPRSLQDTGGDGVGDLPGIHDRLPYLASLGVRALWISPFYPSPMADFGYDVANYTGVDPLFGTLDDFDRLIAAVHAQDMKLIVDFVPNHTSSEHPWFVESRSSRDNPKRDWYLWRDPGPDGGPPNNWMSHFGGPAWTYDERTGQYFYHSFLTAQPDLNWRNPEVKAAMYDAMRFWLDRGVDGFRMDVLWLLIKDDQYRANPLNPDWKGGNSFASVLPLYTADRPETHRIVAEMREVMDAYPERVLIGEIYLPIDKLVQYYGVDPNTSDLRGADMPFNFHLILTPWQAEPIASLIRNYEAALPAGAWPNWVLGNHDQPRLATRLGAGQVRVATMMLLTLRGTPTLYYGDEIGMPDAVVPPDRVQDPAEKNQPGIGQGRDPERSPMPWDSSPKAGFTTGEPWLPLIADHSTRNVERQSGGQDSELALCRRLLALRAEHPALHSGTVAEVRAENGVLLFQRHPAQDSEGSSFQIVLNLTGEHREVQAGAGRVLVTTLLDGEGGEVAGKLVLEAGEGVVLTLPAKSS